MIEPLLLVALCLGAAAEEPIALDGTRQLFLDDYLIASRRNVTRKVHPAEKYPGNPVVRSTEPWEGKVVVIYGSVLRDGEKYRMWYHMAGGVGYAESVDGIAWNKPKLGVVRIDGQDTNIVVRGDAPQRPPGALPYCYEVFGVHRDDRDPDPARRYKMGFLSIHRGYTGPHADPFHGGQRRGLGVAASPDGIHWRLVNNWASDAICDGDTHWMFDPARKKYVLYGRTKYISQDVARLVAENPWTRRYFWGRSVARIASEDFLNWNVTEPAKAPVVMTTDVDDPLGDEIYSMMVFPYEGLYIGLVQVFHNQPDACYLDIQLAVSRDGFHFERVGDREAFIPVGPRDSWDPFNNSLATNPPIAVGDTLRFYYGGRTYRHSPYRGPDPGVRSGGIGLATIQRDRFVSLGASDTEGQLVTKRLRLAAGRLHLNANSDSGRIVIEVLDPAGRPIARSKPITQDGLNVPVPWAKGGLAGLDTPVTLRITLQNARLFAVWCKDKG